jgi:YD repeat-containing protein
LNSPSINNSLSGDYANSAFDIIGIGGTWMGLQAKELRVTPILNNNQYEFSFMSDKVTKTANILDKTSQWIRAIKMLRLGRKLYDILGLQVDVNVQLVDEEQLGQSKKSRDSRSHKEKANKGDFYPPSDGGGGGGSDIPGGPGATCGCGLTKPPNRPGALNPFTKPNNIGGIYLKGAGKALVGLGSLVGIAIDPYNGRLILISKEKREVHLPPLRMDDVVTIFRSVYQQGDAPYVSIDPDSQNPEGPQMLIQHGPGTENTYVGWTLFECDRVMKAYSLGFDNVSKRQLVSKVQGYQSLLTLGFTNYQGNQRDPIWERFWLVPAKVNRKRSSDTLLTLLDVPLKVNTERMEMRNGQLVPATNPTPSVQANTFAEWFTSEYDKIAKEASSQPPSGCGCDSSVYIYEELQRLALISAIAENLRDQGVPMPAWMRDYEVSGCSMAATTPSIIVSGSSGNRVQRIYGGATLSCPNVRTENNNSIAEALSKKIQEKMAFAPLFSPVDLNVNGQVYQATALPGNDTRDFNACYLEAVDLALPIQGNRSIAIVRKYNSFFKNKDIFGNAWTLDMPRLEAQQKPVSRQGSSTTYEVVYQLYSPLNTYQGYFSRRQFVPEANNILPVPQEPSSILGLADADDDRIGLPTKMLLFNDGKRWHFDRNGFMRAIEENGICVVYQYNTEGRITHFVGCYGSYKLAEIQLEYDGSGRIVLARGDNGSTIQYGYDSNGYLIRVESGNDLLEYQYSGDLLIRIKHNGKLFREFSYTDWGKVKYEKREGGSAISYDLLIENNSYHLHADSSIGAFAGEEMQYDPYMRPLRQVFGDGTQLDWKYGEIGTEAVITLLPGECYILQESADGKESELKIPEGGIYRAKYDDRHRLIEVLEDQHPILRQEWLRDGRLDRSIYETFTVHQKYDNRGIPNGVMLTPPDETGSQLSRWLEIENDPIGRLSKISGFTGGEASFSYDKNGYLSILQSNKSGMEIINNEAGNIASVRTSWGYQQTNYYDAVDSILKKIVINQGNESSDILFNKGRLEKIRTFDGGEYSFIYRAPLYKSGFYLPFFDSGIAMENLAQIQTPNGLQIDFGYDANERINSINYGGIYSISLTYTQSGCVGGCSMSGR